MLPPGDVLIGEAWETEVSTIAENEPYTGKTLGTLVAELGPALLGEQAIAVFGHRFPLLAKFIDANAKLSVQVHPDDSYAAHYEGGQLGKTEFWFILAAEPDASIVHGFQAPTSQAHVQQAIEDGTLETLLHEERVSTGDVIFVPAGTVHAIGSGVLLYELQEYSDITYRMYDYGRPTAAGTPRELHIERSLAVSHYGVSSQVKMQPVSLAGGPGYTERYLVACRYFITRELCFSAPDEHQTVCTGHSSKGALQGYTHDSCIILSSLGARVQVSYGEELRSSELLAPGQTMVLPAALGNYTIEGSGTLLSSSVPSPNDEAWNIWKVHNTDVR